MRLTVWVEDCDGEMLFNGLGNCAHVSIAISTDNGSEEWNLPVTARDFSRKVVMLESSPEIVSAPVAKDLITYEKNAQSVMAENKNTLF